MRTKTNINSQTTGVATSERANKKVDNNRMLNNLAFQVPKIEQKLDNERQLKIYQAMKNSEPFKEDQSLTLQSFSDIYGKIKYEHFASGEIVFSYGDFGSKFYIIIKGSVSVQIPLKQSQMSELQQVSPTKTENSPLKRGTSSKKSIDETIPYNNANEDTQNNPYGLLKNGGTYSKFAPISNSTDVKSDFKLGPEHSTLSPRQRLNSQQFMSMMSQRIKQSASSTSSLQAHQDPQQTQQFQEVSILREGAHFGDFALIHQKPRSATIQCLEDCLFAIIDKQMYDSEFKNIKNHHNARIKYLQTIPFFATWTRTTLAKFTYYLKRHTFKRNQLLYKEGDPCSHIFLVISGDFEVLKRVKSFHHKAVEADLKAKNGGQNVHPMNKPKVFKMTGVVGQDKSVSGPIDFDMMEFLPHTQNKKYQDNVKNTRFLQAVSIFKGRRAFFDQGQNLRAMIIGTGNIIGEEDAMKVDSNNAIDTFYTTTVQCFSQTAEAFSVKSEDFRKFVTQTDMDTWRALEKNALQKELNILKIMEGRYKREEQSNQVSNVEMPNKYIDNELNYMKEIRKAYFLPRDDELKQLSDYYDRQQLRQQHQNASPFEITGDNSSSSSKLEKVPLTQNRLLVNRKATIELNSRTLLAKKSTSSDVVIQDIKPNNVTLMNQSFSMQRKKTRNTTQHNESTLEHMHYSTISPYVNFNNSSNWKTHEHSRADLLVTSQSTIQSMNTNSAQYQPQTITIMAQSGNLGQKPQTNYNQSVIANENSISSGYESKKRGAGVPLKSLHLNRQGVLTQGEQAMLQGFVNARITTIPPFFKNENMKVTLNIRRESQKTQIVTNNSIFNKSQIQNRRQTQDNFNTSPPHIHSLLPSLQSKQFALRNLKAHTNDGYLESQQQLTLRETSRIITNTSDINNMPSLRASQPIPNVKQLQQTQGIIQPLKSSADIEVAQFNARDQNNNSSVLVATSQVGFMPRYQQQPQLSHL